MKIGKNYYIDRELFEKWQKDNMNTYVSIS